MKHVINEQNGLKALFLKRPGMRTRVGLLAGMAAVLAVSLIAFFSLVKMSKDVNPQSSSQTVSAFSASQMTASRTTSASSAVTSATGSKPTSAYAKKLQIAGFIKLSYPDDSVPIKHSETEYYSSQSDFDEIRESVSKVLDLIPSTPSEESFGKGKLITIQFGINSNDQYTVSVFKPADGSKTVFEVQGDDSSSARFYSCDNSVYDKVFEFIKPYTLDAAKTTADKFLKAFAGKDAKTLASLANPMSDIDSWNIMGEQGGAIQNITCEPLAGNSKAFQVSFDVGDGDSYPFSTGHNERILEIGMMKNGNSYGAVCFVDASKYTKPQTEPEIQCEQFCNTVTPTDFTSASDLDPLGVLNYILQYEKGSLKITDSANFSGNANLFSQVDIDSYAKSLFGLDHIDGSKSQQYNINGDFYMGSYNGNDSGSNDSQIRFIQTTEDTQGNCSVTIEVYTDPLEAIDGRTLRFDLQKNDDGTYRFIRAVNLS